MWSSRRDKFPISRGALRSGRVLRLWLIAALAIAVTVLSPVEASAQRGRVSHAVPRSPVYVARSYHPVYHHPGYYRPAYYYPGYRTSFAFGVSFGWYGGWYGWPGYYGWAPSFGYAPYGWGPYGYAPYGFYGSYPYPYYYDYAGSARLQVRPREAEVYVDGHLVGLVDDFDGSFQRLRVAPGEHQLEIFLQGYRTYRQNILFRPGATIKIEQMLQPLGAGEQPEARPVPSPGKEQQQPPYRREPINPEPPRREPANPPSRGAESQDYGAIAVRVQPTDAAVLVNGERWESPQAGDLTLQLAEGSYRVEIRKDGYRPYSATIRVQRGQTTSLNVSLSRQ
jgi:PEGA domain